MKTRKYKTWQLAALLLLCIVVPSSLVIALTKQQSLQESCKGHHESRKEFYSHIRVLPPVTITEITGNRVNYAMVDQGIELGSFDLEGDYSIVPKGFDASNHGGCYGISYCSKHLVILSVDVLPQSNCGVVKQ